MLPSRQLNYCGEHKPKDNLSGLDLRGSKFVGSSLQGFLFQDCILDGVDFTDADLTNTNFIRAQCNGAQFERTKLWKAYFHNSRCVGAKFDRSFIRDVRFEGSNLRNASFFNCDLSGSIFKGADLTEADIRLSFLHNVDFSKACMFHAELYSSMGIDIYFYNAVLCGATLEAVHYPRANFRGALLCGANMKEGEFHNARFKNSDIDEDPRYTKACDYFLAKYGQPKLPHIDLPGGDLIVYKAVGQTLVELIIPKEARRVRSVVSRKCRAEFVKVTRIFSKATEVISSKYFGVKPVVYKVGETVYPDKYDPNPLVECSSGIHFFQSREEAMDMIHMIQQSRDEL